MSLQIKTKNGLTLIELLIVMVVLFILLGSSTLVFLVGLRSWNSGNIRSSLRQDSSLAMERMERDLSQASSLTNADADTITFLADIDTDGSDETVTFEVIANELIRTVDGADIALAPNVSILTLSYRDLDDNLLSLPSGTASQGKRDTVRIILISLDMSQGDETFNLSSSVYIRNQPPPA